MEYRLELCLGLPQHFVRFLRARPQLAQDLVVGLEIFQLLLHGGRLLRIAADVPDGLLAPSSEPQFVICPFTAALRGDESLVRQFLQVFIG